MPSLKALHGEIKPDEGLNLSDTVLQQTLLDVLLDNNVSSSSRYGAGPYLQTLTSPATSLVGKEPSIGAYIDTPWILSQQGKKTMPRGATAVNMLHASGATTPASPSSERGSIHDIAWWHS